MSHPSYHVNLSKARVSVDLHPFEQKTKAWLQEAGFQSHPFDRKYLDAGADPQLAAYLVGHDSFAALWHDQPSIISAPVGGGKTAFRVRLARACRVGQDGRSILPVIYKLPTPRYFDNPSTRWLTHLRFINQAIAVELLLHLAYHPERYFVLNEATQIGIAQQLEVDFPQDLENFLEQLKDKASLMPLVNAFDPSAAELFAQPHPTTQAQFYQLLLKHLATHSLGARQLARQAPDVRFDSWLQRLKGMLGYETIYLLIDGVDAYPQTQKPRFALEVLDSLLRQSAAYASEKVYFKFFLPVECAKLLDVARLLPFGQHVEWGLVSIHWTQPMLNELLQKRLHTASQGYYNNLEELCSPALRGITTELIDFARPLPREVLALAERLFFERIQRNDLLAPIEICDFVAAKAWYEQERSSKQESAE